MTHSQIAWTIYAFWLGAAVVYVRGDRSDFIKKHTLIWWLCAIPMVAPMLALAIVALFIQRPIDLIFTLARDMPKETNPEGAARERTGPLAAPRQREAFGNPPTNAR